MYNILIVRGSLSCQLKTQLDTANEWEIINWKKNVPDTCKDVIKSMD